MSTYSQLTKLQEKYQSELESVKEGQVDNHTVQLLERIVQDLNEVSTYASWEEYPEDMGR